MVKKVNKVTMVLLFKNSDMVYMVNMIRLLKSISVSLAPTCNSNIASVSAWAKATTVFVFVCV